MHRHKKLLANLDVRTATGIEIGPLVSPTVRKEEGRVFYVDHDTTENLHKKFANDPNIDVDRIVPIDAVWGNRTLREALGEVRADYIIASHVVEHVPDLLGWLNELREVLQPGGTIRLAIPDKRYTFDYLRRLTVLSDVVTAHSLRARIPLPWCVMDHFLNLVTVDAVAAWNGTLDPDKLVRMYRPVDAIALTVDAHKNGNYHDSHCWVLTPRSFALLLAEAAELGFVNLACDHFYDTARNDFEFFVALKSSDDQGEIVASWQRMAQAVA